MTHRVGRPSDKICFRYNRPVTIRVPRDTTLRKMAKEYEVKLEDLINRNKSIKHADDKIVMGRSINLPRHAKVCLSKNILRDAYSPKEDLNNIIKKRGIPPTDLFFKPDYKKPLNNPDYKKGPAKNNSKQATET